ncbi:MAG TPA: hypothetical protein VIF09_18235 [Polyangiaceae bacterium]
MNRERFSPVAFALAIALAPSTASAQATSSPGEARIGLHLVGPRRAVLQRQSPIDGTWSSVCVAPCDLPLPLAATYRIDGDDVQTSAPFHVDGAPGGHVVVDVRPGHATLRALGVMAAVLGSLTVLAGGLYTAVGNIDLAFQLPPGAAPPPPPGGVSDTGLALVGVGTLAIALGVIAVATNVTRVSAQSSPGTSSQRIAADASNPSPAWPIGGRRELPLPTAAEVPIWTVRF